MKISDTSVAEASNSIDWASNSTGAGWSTSGSEMNSGSGSGAGSASRSGSGSGSGSKATPAPIAGSAGGFEGGDLLALGSPSRNAISALNTLAQRPQRT